MLCVGKMTIIQTWKGIGMLRGKNFQLAPTSSDCEVVFFFNEIAASETNAVVCNLASKLSYHEFDSFLEEWLIVICRGG